MGGLCSLPTPISPLLLITSPWRRGQEQSLPGSPGIPLAGRRKARFLDLTSLWANRMISTPAFCAVRVNFCEHQPVLGWLPEQSVPSSCPQALWVQPADLSLKSFHHFFLFWNSASLHPWLLQRYTAFSQRLPPFLVPSETGPWKPLFWQLSLILTGPDQTLSLAVTVAWISAGATLLLTI